MRINQIKLVPLKKNCKGFSLLEVIVAVLILGILSVTAVPKIKPLLEDLRLQTAANAIKHQLYIARSRAVGDPQVHCGVYFDTLKTPHTVQTFLDDGDPAGNNQYDPGKDHVFMAAYQMPSTIKMQIGGVGNCSVIIFRGDGSAKVRGLTLTVRNSLNKTKRVSVLASTGRIKLY